jgi:signal-transduction protein with cAMP-binding, CBS, and nucleotidyltransferase domain
MASAPQEVWGDLATTAFVQASHLFKSLEPDAVQDLLKLARVVRHAAGETISAAADDGFYLVLEGAAAMFAPGPGGPVAVSSLERGAFFGVARALGASRPWALAARTDAAVVAFPGPVIGALAGRFPRMRKLLEAVLAARDKEAAGERTQ